MLRPAHRPTKWQKSALFVGLGLDLSVQVFNRKHCMTGFTLIYSRPRPLLFSPILSSVPMPQFSPQCSTAIDFWVGNPAVPTSSTVALGSSLDDEVVLFRLCLLGIVNNHPTDPPLSKIKSLGYPI